MQLALIIRKTCHLVKTAAERTYPSKYCKNLRKTSRKVFDSFYSNSKTAAEHTCFQQIL